MHILLHTPPVVLAVEHLHGPRPACLSRRAAGTSGPQLQVPGGAHPQVLERREGGRRERLQDADKDSLEHQEAVAGVDSLKSLFHGSWEGMRGAR